MSGTTHLIQHHIPQTDMNHKLCCHGNMKPHTFIDTSLMSFRMKLARKLPKSHNLLQIFAIQNLPTWPDPIQANDHSLL